MELRFRFSILGFVFGIYLYLYIFFLFLCLFFSFCSSDYMMDRHCVNKMSVIILLQPMDCQRAVLCAQGVGTSVERGRVENGLRAEPFCLYPTAPMRPLPPQMKETPEWKEEE